MRNMNNMIKYCNCQKAGLSAEYLKMQTGGNDPSISARMRYAAYVRSSNPQQITKDKYFLDMMSGIIQ